MTHIEDSAEVRLTFDPSGPLYTIAITTPAPWPDADVFGITFDGPNALTISTDRQTLSNANRTLTVSDRGFGNVLNGLAQNATAIAFTGDTAVQFSLDGAEPEVAIFRACLDAPTA
ncbi:hypothetical protein [Tropicimonas sp. S265A]|uniref:hypothetical protein n=1 Tax=Tropicimonas sp. S265A TaxID=3415134 RepID=UPI003C7CD873